MVLQYLPLFEDLIRRVEDGKRVALCAVVKTRGSTPQSPGAMMAVDEGMNTAGTLGGGCVEAEVRKRAFELLRQGDAQLLDFQLDHDYGWDDGLICGGGMDIAVLPVIARDDTEQFRQAMKDMNTGREAHVRLRVRHGHQWQEYRILVEAEPKLLIAGAGHIGACLAKMCVDLEFDVTVVDDRGDFANAERLPPPIHILVGDIEQTLRHHTIDRNTYVVIVTRGHNHDEQALGVVIDSNAKYLGMIGSRRKIKLIYDDLQAGGVKPELFERVHAPVGLDISAATVPEIALSIAAQLVSIRRAGRRHLVEGPLPVSSRDEK